MKKCFLLLILLLLIVGCGKEKEEKNNKEETFKAEAVVKEPSVRKKDLDKLIIDELKRKGYINEKKLDYFTIEEIFVYGYYKSDPSKKDMQINYDYKCKDDKDDCVKTFRNGYGGYLFWVRTDEKKIYEIKEGVTLSYSDVESGNYVMVNETIE